MRKLAFLMFFGISTTLIASGIGLRSVRNAEFPGKKQIILNDQQQKKDTTVKVVYTCPMHSEIVQDKPGKCPKCGMNLVAKEVVKDVYTCPMHPDVTSDKAGKCPKCGMNLVKKEPPKKPASSKS